MKRFRYSLARAHCKAISGHLCTRMAGLELPFSLVDSRGSPEAFDVTAAGKGREKTRGNWTGRRSQQHALWHHVTKASSSHEPLVSLHTRSPASALLLAHCLTSFTSLPYHLAKQQRKRRSSINAYRGGKQDSPQQQQQQYQEEAAPTPKSAGRKSGKRSSRKSSSKNGRAAEVVVEAAQQQQEEEEEKEQRGVAFGEDIMHDIIAEAGEAAIADEEPELKVEVAAESMDAEATATAAATAALYQAALSFAQPALQKKSGASVASTPVRKSTGGFLLPTASSSVKKRSMSMSTSFSATLTSSSVPDTLSLCASTPAWRPSSARPTPQTGTLTVPFSPKFRVDARSKSCARPVPLSTSEREAAQMDEDRRKLHEQIRRSQEHFLRSKAAAANAREREQDALRPRSTKELTVPHTPSFALDKRHGKRTVPPPHTADEAAAGNKASLKPNKRLLFDDEAAPAPAHNGPKKPTQFEPFKFATDARVSARQTSGEAPRHDQVLVPAAEIAAKFLQSARQYDAPKTTACKGVTIP